MESVIKWQTGVPTKDGMYLVTISGYVTTSAFLKRDVYDEHFFKEYVTAWFKISDIEPYKNE